MLKRCLAIILVLVSTVVTASVDTANADFVRFLLNKKTEETFEPNQSKRVYNAFGEEEVESANLYFSVDYLEVDSSPYIDSVLIFYTTEIESKKQKWIEKNWRQIGPLSSGETSYLLEALSGDGKYVFQVAHSKTGKLQDIYKDPNNLTVSRSIKFRSERAWGVLKALILLGALGIFIFGMKMMSEGLQKAAGGQMRSILSSMTSNRFKGVFSGFLMTGLVQSSSATTVMTVSFVNAGLLTLVQSAGIMMGANIGTTITAWLIDKLGFKVDIETYSLILVAVAIPILFSKKEKRKAWGTTIVGFALLFMGLGMLKDIVPSLGQDSPIVKFFVDYKDIPVLSHLMFVFLGAFVTIVIQSSSAAMALTMALCWDNVIPFEVACAMILGENIGTTITAEIASLVGNVHAKRSARIHSLFNVVGVTWAVASLSWFLIPFVRWITMSVFTDDDPFTNQYAATTGMAVFHSTFNILNVVLLIGFLPWVVKLATRTVKSRGVEDEEFHLEYIGTGILATSELSIVEAKKEVGKFGRTLKDMNDSVVKMVNVPESKTFERLLAKIRHLENITDKLEEEIAMYLTKVAQNSLTDEASKKIRAIHKMISDLERIGDVYYRMSVVLERKKENKVWFIQSQRDALNHIFDQINENFEMMIKAIDSDFGSLSSEEISSKRFLIHAIHEEMLRNHILDMEKAEYNFKSGMHFKDLFNACHLIGDLTLDVCELMQLKKVEEIDD